MDAKTTTVLLGLLLLVAGPLAAAEGDGEPDSPATGCSAVAVMPYEPYYAVRPECLPPPLGEG